MVDELLSRVAAHTPQAIRQVQAALPSGFPQALAEAVFSGLTRAAQRLEQVVA